MSVFGSIAKIWRDPPPGYAFELSEAGIAAARLGVKAEMAFRPLKTGAISVSPLRDNIFNPDEVSFAVREVAGVNGNRKRRDAALIIPDYCTRIAVLDFDEFPADAKEQVSLVRFRMKKTVPYDVDAAALSYWPQHGGGKKYDVVVVVAPAEIVSRYESPFRGVGLNPGLVIPSSIAALHLVPDAGLTVVAKLTGRVLTMLVLQKGVLKLVRCLELASQSVEEVAADLYPTFVFIEDSLGARPDKLLLCGFGAGTEEARRQFQAELNTEVDTLRSPLGTPGENDAGLLGYLKSIALNN